MRETLKKIIHIMHQKTFSFFPYRRFSYLSVNINLLMVYYFIIKNKPRISYVCHNNL